MKLKVCASLTFLCLCSSTSLSAAPGGGSLQQLAEMVFEDGRVELIPFTPQHATGLLSTVKAHKLSPSH